MTEATYNIVMFAYNEQDNIEASITSIYNNINRQLNQFYLIANGCTDKTVETAKSIKSKFGFEQLQIIELTLGDKCNAWNTYVHELADDVDVHFFTDADVQFSAQCFEKMTDRLTSVDKETVIVAGMPLSGRNVEFYRSLVTDRACFFGNLYGMRHSFIGRIREVPFHLPIGLNWIDSFLTKAANTDLKFTDFNLPNRTTWIENVGYDFEKLSVFKRDDIRLYINRIARYELGKIQEMFLDKLPCEEWPRDMLRINREIEANFDDLTSHLGYVKRRLVKKRLLKILKKSNKAK